MKSHHPLLLPSGLYSVPALHLVQCLSPSTAVLTSALGVGARSTQPPLMYPGR